LAKNSIFGQNLDFSSEYGCLTKIFIFDKKFDFWHKNLIFDKKFDFWHKFWFFAIMLIFNKKIDFRPKFWFLTTTKKIRFVTNISIFDLNFDFCQNFPFLTNFWRHNFVSFSKSYFNASSIRAWNVASNFYRWSTGPSNLLLPNWSNWRRKGWIINSRT